MNAFFSSLFGVCSAVAICLIFPVYYIGYARPLALSLGLALLAGASLYAISIYFDRRDAWLNAREPTRILPSGRGFLSLLFSLYVYGATAGFCVAIVLAWLQIPNGDSWGLAAIRLLFCLAVPVLAWQTHTGVARIGNRLFAGHIYSDTLESLGQPLSLAQVRHELELAFPSWLLILLAIASAAVLLGNFQWLEPILESEMVSRRARNMKRFVAWLLAHPQTVDLFATVICAASLCTLVRHACTRWEALWSQRDGRD